MENILPSEHDLALILEPISAQKPCGESLRYTEVYDQIREARREEDKNLPQGVWKTEVKKADWEEVAEICLDVLKTRSKDLQVAAWLSEAWLHLYGPTGLSRGLELILGLTQNFWDHLYPQITDKGFELRTVPYEWINSRLSEEIGAVAISSPSDHTALSYQFITYNEANLRLVSEKAKQTVNAIINNTEPTVSIAKVNLSIDQTATPFYRYMLDGCDSTLKCIKEIEDLLHMHFQGAAPGLYRLREKIEGLKRFALHILDERGEKIAKKKDSTQSSSVPEVKPKARKGPIESREQAYALLAEVASYLEGIEPHSPTPYLIHRAISWGGMTLSQVVETTLSNGHDMSLLLDILNVKKKD